MEFIYGPKRDSNHIRVLKKFEVSKNISSLLLSFGQISWRVDPNPTFYIQINRTTTSLPNLLSLAVSEYTILGPPHPFRLVGHIWFVILCEDGPFCVWVTAFPATWSIINLALLFATTLTTCTTCRCNWESRQFTGLKGICPCHRA